MVLAFLLLAVVLAPVRADAGPVTLLEAWDPRLHFPGDATLAAEAASACARVIVRLRPDGSRARTPSAVANGSGILLDAAGHVVTAAHVVSPAASVEVRTADGVTRRARILAFDADQELALLRITPFEGLSTAPTERRRPLVAGERVLAIGAARRQFAHAAVGRVHLASANEPLTYETFAVQHPVLLRMSITPGFSGGPVLDAEGQLVGMVTSFAFDHYYGPFTTGTAHMVPLADILQFRDQVLHGLAYTLAAAPAGHAGQAARDPGRRYLRPVSSLP